MLSEREAYELLHSAILLLGMSGGATPAANTALIAARLALTAYQMALLAAMDAEPPRVLLPPPY